MTWWWSYLLAAIGVFGLYLTIRWTRNKPEPPPPRRRRTHRDPGPEMPGPWD